MKRTGAFLVLMLLSAVGSSAPPAPEPPIRLPSTPVVPAPTPPPPTDGVTKLGADQLYVIDSDVPCIVLGSPDGVVKITENAGPITIKSKFVDSVGFETRTYKGKHVYSVEGVRTTETKVTRCELLIYPNGATKTTDVLRRLLDVTSGLGPIPPPIDPPTPGPTPKPPDPPAPKGFRVIFVYETAGPITAAMQQVMFGEKVRTYLDAKTVAGAGGKGWRRWDKDVIVTNEKDADIKALWQAAKPQLNVVPCVIISVDNKAEIHPFPANEDAALDLFRKYGGN